MASFASGSGGALGCVAAAWALQWSREAGRRARAQDARSDQPPCSPMYSTHGSDAHPWPKPPAGASADGPTWSSRISVWPLASPLVHEEGVCVHVSGVVALGRVAVNEVSGETAGGQVGCTGLVFMGKKGIDADAPRAKLFVSVKDLRTVCEEDKMLKAELRAQIRGLEQQLGVERKGAGSRPQ